LLTIILLDVCRLEILWVLDVVEDSAKGGEAIGVVHKLCSTSCVDDIPCVHDGIGYLFPVVPVDIVIVVWLRLRDLVYWWLAAPGAMAARGFLILLISLVLLLLLLLMLVASGGTACLMYDYCRSP
jgi:hypothetical protein